MTLIEAIVWISITTVTMGAIVLSVISFYRANTYTLEQAQAVSAARRSFETVVATIREASFASDGAYPVVSMATSSFAFYADIDDDPLIERVRYTITNTTMEKRVLDPTGDPPTYSGTETMSVVTNHIRNEEQGVDGFTYYDKEGSQITDLTDISALRFVRLTTVVNVSPDRLPNELTMRSSATLRNLR